VVWVVAETTAQTSGAIVMKAILTAGHRPSTPSEQLADLKQYSEQKIIFMNCISGKKRNCGVKRFITGLHADERDVTRGEPRRTHVFRVGVFSQLSDRIRENAQ
jgi:hypothetical protein